MVRRHGVLLALAGLALAVLFSLGTWQVQRLQWKNDLIAKTEARADAEPVDLLNLLEQGGDLSDLEYTAVSVSGGFPSTKVAHVFGTWEGRPGYYVFQTLMLDDGTVRFVLINRGFVPQDDVVETYPLPSADRMKGLLRTYSGAPGLAKAVAPNERNEEGFFFERDLGALADYLTPGEGERYLPVAIDSTLATAIPQGGTTRLEFRNAHLGYAITWYGLAIGLIGVVAVKMRRDHR